jgi:Fe-S-cluster containining protein
MPDEKGRINSCSTSGCGYSCCQFQQGNYIVLYPGELEAAAASGQSVAHLNIIDADYHGGQKAICQASNTASCDNGFKPLDCVSYPFFPDVDPQTEKMSGFIKGKKCPLQTQHLMTHWLFVLNEWNKVINRYPGVARWLGKVDLVGYTEPLRPDTAPATAAMPKRSAAA